MNKKDNISNSSFKPVKNLFFALNLAAEWWFFCLLLQIEILFSRKTGLESFVGVGSYHQVKQRKTSERQAAWMRRRQTNVNEAGCENSTYDEREFDSCLQATTIAAWLVT